MAIEHALICGACERECPSWADRCPTCGSLSLVHRITIVSASRPLAAVGAKPPRKKAARPRIAAAAREASRPESAQVRSTA